MLVPGPTLGAGPGVVVVAGPMEAAAAGPAVPRGAGLGLSAVVASTEAEVAGAAPRGPGAAAAPTPVLLAACLGVAGAPTVAERVFAPEGGSMWDECGRGPELAPEVGSTKSGLESSRCWLSLGAVLVPGGPGVRPREAGMGTDWQLVPGAGPEPTDVLIAAAAAAVVVASGPQPRWSVEAGSDLVDRSPPELRPALTLVGLQLQGESGHWGLLWWWWC